MSGTPSSSSNPNVMNFKGLQEMLNASISGGVSIAQLADEKDRNKITYVFTFPEASQSLKIPAVRNTSTLDLAHKFFETVYFNIKNNKSECKIRLTSAASGNFEKVEELRSARRRAGRATATATARTQVTPPVQMNLAFRQR